MESAPYQPYPILKDCSNLFLLLKNGFSNFRKWYNLEMLLGILLLDAIHSSLAPKYFNGSSVKSNKSLCSITRRSGLK